MNKTAATLMLVLLAIGSAAAEGGDTARMTKLKDFIIYQDAKFYCAFPSLVIRPDGELLCAFRRAPDRRALWNGVIMHVDANSQLVMLRSKDSGATWTTNPELILAHPMGGSQDPCMTQLTDGSIICSSYGWALTPPEAAGMFKDTANHLPYAFLGGYLVRSDDGGHSWKGPFVPMHVPTDGTKDALGNPTPAFNRGQIIQGKDAKLYWAVTASKTKGSPTQVHLLTSADRGETWTYACPIAQDEKVTFNETSLIETPKGDIVAFLRTDNLAGNLAYARSTDGGKSFGPWNDAGFFGHPFQATRLADGRVFLIYGYRKAPHGVRARLLNSECTNIEQAPELIIRDDSDNGDLGYPWTVQLPDGKILAAYYFNKANGTRHIGGSLIEVK